MILPSQIIITIPIYKPAPSIEELASLNQLVKVLGHYPIAFIKPVSLNASVYLRHCPEATVIDFEDKYFKNIAGYNALTMSALLYSTFKAYNYMLIYQLDAWVFSDQLTDWANKNYDYIGAPWIEMPPANPNKEPIIDLRFLFKDKVGNGGFSLRKISTHLNICTRFKWLISIFPKNEDMFWSIFAARFLNYKVPPVSEALYFAFELNPSKSFEITNHILPFGCHAWEKYDIDFWKKYITIEI